MSRAFSLDPLKRQGDVDEESFLKLKVEKCDVSAGLSADNVCNELQVKVREFSTSKI